MARLALEFRPDAFLLHRRTDEGEWEEAAGAPLPAAPLAPDFDAAIALMRGAAREISGEDAPEVDLWLPPERVLVARVGPGEPPEAAFGGAAEDLTVASSPDGAAAAAVERAVVEEALAYARRWGFAPARVGARAGLTAFPDGPEFSAEAETEARAAAPRHAQGWLRPARAIAAGVAALVAALLIWLIAGFPDGGAPLPPAAAPAAPLVAAGLGGGAPIAPASPEAERPAAMAFAAAEPAAARSAPPAVFSEAAFAPGAAGTAPRAFAADGMEPGSAPAAPSPDAPPALISAAGAEAAPERLVSAPRPDPAPSPGPGAVEAAPAPTPAPDPAAIESGPSGPGAVARAPRPLARPAALDMSPSETALKLAPAPKWRPKSIGPRAPAMAAPKPASPAAANGVREVSAPRRPPPQAPGVAGAATLKGAIALDEMSLLGVFGGAGERRALLRLPDGRVQRVSRGNTVEGWTVDRIEATAMRLTRSGEARMLDLAR